MNLLCAASMGAVSGLRSLSGPAIVSGAAPFQWLAAGEILADKLPFMPNRTDPPSLAFRAVSGAYCGYKICGRGKWTGALVGAMAAVAASYAGLEYRKRATLPPLLAAVVEDAVAIGIGYLTLSYTTRSHENCSSRSLPSGPGGVYRNR